MKDVISYRNCQTPIGPLHLYEQSGSLVKILFDTAPSEKPNRAGDSRTVILNDTALLLETERQIKAYFDGRIKSFDIPIDPRGTDFQKNAWRVLRQIPFGQTITYAEQALAMGGIQYSRAVGQANRRNPLPIIIPCHRVIGKNNELTGYAGGLEMKRLLLKVEGSLPVK